MSFPIECKYVTDECVREWKTGSTTSRVLKPVPMLRFLYELCWVMVRGELPIQKCKLVLDSVEFSDDSSKKELASCFSDIVTQMVQEIIIPGDHRARLIKLAKWLVESALVPLRLLQERCEEEFLWEAEMVKIKAQDLKGKEVRVNTRLLYQQTKFNLHREESEGYAKLVTLLCQEFQGSSESILSSTVGIIKSIIGHFDLDPNRVFDIVLECFELQPNSNIFLQLIPIFPKSHASQILGFKFQYYQRIEVTTPVPFGLYQLTALLVKQNLIDLAFIYSHLLPKDEDAYEHYNTFSVKKLDEANKIGKINLAATGKDLMEDEKQGDLIVDLFTALDTEAEAVSERLPEMESSQTLGLLAGFLFADDWYHACLLFDRLSPLNPVAHIQICNGVFRLIEKSISSAYNIVRESRIQRHVLPLIAGGDGIDETSSLGCRSIDLGKDLFQMLTTVGPYLYRDTILLQKVCMVLRGYYLSALKHSGRGDTASNHETLNGNQAAHLHLKEVRVRIDEALGACILPSLQLIPANPAVGHEIWELMSLLPYELRYRLYGEWEKDDEQNPMILTARQTAKLDTRRILKRLTKDNLKQLSRMVAKLAHANPMTVLRTIVQQIEAYKDMIAPVVDAFKYLTQLEYDILEYVVIERLVQGGRDKLKDDGLHLSDWLQSLASFWGHLCKKYPSMELRGLFQYLVNQLKKGQGVELVLLQELIQQMANVQYMENLTEEQLDAMAGSEMLRYLATSFGMTRNNKALIKSTNRLRDSLLPKDDPKLAMPLLLLMAQHRSLVVINAEAPHIKMVSEEFDRCHGTLLQYVEFLSSAITPVNSYADLIPSLHDLVHEYHLDAEVTFLIYRPVMRLFQSGFHSDVFWPSDDKLTEITSETMDYEPPECSGKLILDLGSSKSMIWEDLLNIVRTMLPVKAWNSLSPDLYATFWGLSLYDLHVPKNRYESEIAKQNAALKALEDSSDNSASAIAKRKKDKERIQEYLDRLNSDFLKHEHHVTSVKRRLVSQKDSWLSSCPDTLKINMEFLQRCIFPRCTFSMPDSIYCAVFVQTLHCLGTPYFNTVNHIDVLICKTLQPMICCCTEYEAGRLGRFLCETMRIAYHWKSDESVYDRECGNMPGFAVYYRYPNSQRVTYGQFIKVHWKWSQRISRLLIQCLESTEYVEIRNALILLTKISSVFPVTKRSGINLEKRVSRIKSDEREDLKVLAISVTAALASRRPFWVTDEEFGMGYLEIKHPTVVSKSLSSNLSTMQNMSTINVSHSERCGVTPIITSFQQADASGISSREQMVRTKPANGRPELKFSAMANGSEKGPSLPLTTQIGTLKLLENAKQLDESASRTMEETGVVKVATKNSPEPEISKPLARRPVGGSVKMAKQDQVRDEAKLGRMVHAPETKQGVSPGASLAFIPKGNAALPSSKVLASSSTRTSGGHGGVEPKEDAGTSKPIARDDPSEISSAPPRSLDKLLKRTIFAEETDRLISKRRKGEADMRGDAESSDVRLADGGKSSDTHLPDDAKAGASEQPNNTHRTMDKPSDRSKEKGNERYERGEYRDRPEKPRSEDILGEHSLERGQERSTAAAADRGGEDRSRDDRNNKMWHGGDASMDDRFHRHSMLLPPPPPHMMAHASLQSATGAGRRDEESDRRFGNNRHGQRVSPKLEERERKRSEESLLISQDDAKRRREEEFRDRKREEREALSMKIEEREKERERGKASLMKEEMDASAAAKRRKLKREHILPGEASEYIPLASTASPLIIGLSQPYDARDRIERKTGMIPHMGYMEEPPHLRIHGKDIGNKMGRRDIDPMYDREWEDEKRQRDEQKRRHRK